MKNTTLSKYSGIELFSLYEQSVLLLSCKNATELLETKTLLQELQPISCTALKIFEIQMVLFFAFDLID